MSGSDALPRGWCWTTVGELGEVRLGRQRSPKNRSNKHPTPYIRAANITWDGLDLSDVLDMEFTPRERETYQLRPGDVLLSEASGSPYEVGKPAIWRDEIGVCCFQNTIIRLRSELPPEFLHMLFYYYARNGEFAKASKGVGIHHLSAARFSILPVPLPPENGQRRIVAKIEELFSYLDAGVAALERAKANLKRYRAAVLKAAVEGKLTEQWRAEHPDVESASELLKRILAERRKKWEQDQLAKYEARSKKPPKDWKDKYKEPVEPDTSHLPPLPEGWCWATVEQIVALEPNSLTDGPFGSNLKTAHYTASGPRVVRLQNIGDGFFIDEEAHISEAHFRSLQKHRVCAGDVVVASLGQELPRACLIPASVGPAIVKADCFRLKPCPAVADARFIVGALNAHSTRTRAARIIHGVGRPRLNLRDFRSLALPLPPMEEQANTVALPEQAFSVIDDVTQSLEGQGRRAARLRQSILKRAFEGKLVPQDPNDEPASVLLEQIKAAREAAEAKPKNTKRRKTKSSSR